MDVIMFPEIRKTTSGLQILLHGVISLPDASSSDKKVIDFDQEMPQSHTTDPALCTTRNS